MKNFLLFFPMVLLVFSGYAGNTNEDKKAANHSAFSTQVTNRVGYPSEILHNSKQSVIISYTIDESNIMHITDVSTSNNELKEYIIERLDGKKMKASTQNSLNGVVKIEFVASSSTGNFIQF